MKKINPNKIFTQYRGDITPASPINGRTYTLTHSDLTAELYVFIDTDYAEDQITPMRDEVRLKWVFNGNERYLTGEVLVDGEIISENGQIRNQIFLKEMPTALQAIRYADRFLFERFPILDDYNVYIEFVSSNPDYAKVYDFGTIGSYKQ